MDSDTGYLLEYSTFWRAYKKLRKIIRLSLYDVYFPTGTRDHSGIDSVMFTKAEGRKEPLSVPGSLFLNPYL